RDPARDATTLPLMARVLERGIPMFAICRGFQELNVVLGGSLHQHLAEVPERFDHHPDPDRALEIQYGPSHAVRLTPDGMLAELLDVEEITVNSIHHQGIDRLADRLAIEGVAPDGQVEAVTVRQTRGFALGVQWHPEWRFWENADSAKLFEAFGAACAMRAAQRLADAAA
ncbi:MAG: gamma-glutamyl-gamma-aminobutyrate hydrolase family protein, partial [Azospirillaceae bacterium]